MFDYSFEPGHLKQLFLKKFPDRVNNYTFAGHDAGHKYQRAAQKLVQGFSIDHIKINTGVLAPLAGYTDRLFRQILSTWGCGLYFTEMISAKGICYNPEMSLALAEKIHPSLLVCVQIFGSEPEFIARAAQSINQHGLADIIDLNMGCPVKKVVKTMSGSGLMKDPVLAAECVSALAEASKVPVTVKIRSGWDSLSVNAPEIAELAVKAGARAVYIHPRTRAQMFSGTPDWNTAALVRQTLSPEIPVIANGDMENIDDAIRIMVKTGCDNVMIGRGCLGNPWIFFEMQNLMKPGTIRECLGPQGIGRMIYFHFSSAFKRFGIKGISMLRKHSIWYARGFRDAKKFRNYVFRATTLEDIQKAVTEIFKTDFTKSGLF
jgi:tRNA-dihydrouridine synthase B